MRDEPLKKADEEKISSITPYLRLSPMNAAAPNPAMIPAAGAGVDACCCGWSIGEETGCAGVGSGAASAVGVGSVVAGSHTDAP